VPFEAGGRQMREWVSLVDPNPDEAMELATEALAFLREFHGPGGDRPS
jgi:hypothetical protein